MALSESGPGSVQIGQIAYGPAGHRVLIKAKPGPAKGSMSVRPGGKQAFYKAPTRKGRRK